MVQLFEDPLLMPPEKVAPFEFFERVKCTYGTTLGFLQPPSQFQPAVVAPWHN